MSEELTVLKLVCNRLDSAGLAYMVTGSVAASLHAVPRMTRDIDLVIDLAPSDADRLVARFADDFYIEPDTVREETARRGMFNIIHTDTMVKVDFIVRKESEYRILEFERRRTTVLDGVSIAVVSEEDLILSKLAWARESLSDLQLSDVRRLFRSANLDREYIERWVERLNLSDVYARVVS